MQYPCTRAMVHDVATIKPDQTVEEALTIFRDRDIRNVPVVDDDGKFVGLFGLHQVVLNLLPKAVTMKDGLEKLDFVIDAAPGLAKRLVKLHPVKVSEVLNDNPSVVHCDTPTIEALRMIAMNGSPVVVVEEKTNEFKGIISRETLLANFYQLLEEIDSANDDEGPSE